MDVYIIISNEEMEKIFGIGNIGKGIGDHGGHGWPHKVCNLFFGFEFWTFVNLFAAELFPGNCLNMSNM